MASSTLMGDRRWAPTRKSGMTVLGKVPKPINLPSQRLENHGLDPNTEIVPKGTLTWGSRVSSAIPNAWASSGLSSPNTDGGAGSPINARPSSGGNGQRPSSGGSGPRPSTGGSDKSYEPAYNAWGPHSRPSSSSGVLASNQTSLATTRPRSAETRSGSSQLSRFADNLADNPVAWGATKTADRLGAASSRNDGFTLSSGDFPTLGSEKNSESRGHSSQGRPSSASGRAATQKEMHDCPPSDGNAGVHKDYKNGNSWNIDNYPCGGGSAPPNMERWQRDPQQAPPYSSGNMATRCFEPWHGPAVHPPDGVWYRGGPPGGPFRPLGPHGSYPIEPFPYYSPQLGARPSPNSQAVLRPGASPGGYDPKCVESYGSHLPPDSYMVPGHPVIPFRPGVYPGPVPYDGYYGPHANFHRSVEREVPVREMNVQPAASNQFKQNVVLDSEKLHPRPSSRDPSINKEQKESDQAQGTHQGRYKVLLKQHDSWEGNGAREKRWQSEIHSPSHVERGNRQGTSMWDDEHESNSRKDEGTDIVKLVPSDNASSQPASNWEGHSSSHVITDLSQMSSEAADDIQMKKHVPFTVSVHELPQHPVTKKNTTLIEKIEGLNNKARIVDGHSEAGQFLSKERAKNSKVVNEKVDHRTRTVSSNDAAAENHPMLGGVTLAYEVGTSLENKVRELVGDRKVVSGQSESQAIAYSMSSSQEDGNRAHVQAHKKAHVMQGRVDYRVKSKFNNQNDEDWIKKNSARDSAMTATETTSQDGSGRCFIDCNASSQDVAEAQDSHHATNIAAGSYTASSADSVDHKAQRAKLKEMATQRARQLQKEEEERTREQKAKALAKLEELNRRTSAQGSNQNLNHALPLSNDAQHEQDFGSGTAPRPDASVMEDPCNVPTWDSKTMNKQIDSEVKTLGESTDKSLKEASQPSYSDSHQPVVPYEQSLPLRQDFRAAQDVTYKTSSHSHESGIYKQGQMGYRKRTNISQEKSTSDRPISADSMGNTKNFNDATAHTMGSDSLSSNDEPSVQQRKKNNRGSRNKNKLDEAPPSSSLPSSVYCEEKSEQGPTESSKSQTLSLGVQALSVSSENLSGTSGNRDSREANVTSSDQGLSPAKEEMHGRINNQWRPQPHRRSARNNQAIRPVDKFHGSDTVIWAPIKPPDKNLPLEESGESSVVEPSSNALGKNGLDVQSSVKTKRAEMERYVPKHVANELSQQNSQQASSSLNLAGSVNTAGKSDSGSKSPKSGRLTSPTVGKSEIATDTKVGVDNKPNRRGRVHTSWRQRSSAGSSSVIQNIDEGSVSSDVTKSVQEPSDQKPSSKLDKLSKVPLNHDDWNRGNNDMLPTESVNIPVAIKDQEATNKQKRQQFKAHKFGGSNHSPADNKDAQIGTNDRSGTHSPALDLNDSDVRSTARAENQNAGGDYARSHWQPKSQVYAHNYRPGNRGSGVQRVGSQSSKFNKDRAKGIENHPQQTQDSSVLTQQDDFSEIRNTCHEEVKEERKVPVDPLKEQGFFPNKQTNAELAPSTIDQEQSVSSAYRHHGQQHGRFNRGQEASYKSRDQGQDGVKQNFHTNGNRRKNSSHYEYQQVGSYTKSSDPLQQAPVSEEAQGGPKTHGSRYRERGHNYSRRGGHFYERGGGSAVRVGDYYAGDMLM